MINEDNLGEIYNILDRFKRVNRHRYFLEDMNLFLDILMNYAATDFKAKHDERAKLIRSLCDELREFLTKFHTNTYEVSFTHEDLVKEFNKELSDLLENKESKKY